jgi:hypothetical protein
MVVMRCVVGRSVPLVMAVSAMTACSLLNDSDDLIGSAPDGGAGASSVDASDAAGSGGSGGSSGGGDSGGDSGADSRGGAPAIVIAQSTPTSVATEEVPTLTLPSAPSEGNAIIVGISCISDYQADCVIPNGGVTDNQGNSYTRVLQSQPIQSSAQAGRGYVFIAEEIGAPSGEVVISVDPDGPTTTQAVTWGAIEVAGLAAAPSLDASGIGAPHGTGTTTVTTSAAPAQPNQLAVAVLTVRSADTNIGIIAQEGWTSQHAHQDNSIGPPGHSMVTQVLTGSGVVSHTWTHNPPTRGATAVIATFAGD